MIHLRLISSQMTIGIKKSSPLLDIVPKAFYIWQDRLLSDIPSRSEEPTLLTLFDNPNPSHMKQFIGRYSDVYSSFSYCKAAVTFNQLTNHKIFASLMILQCRCTWLSFSTDCQPSKNCQCHSQNWFLESICSVNCTVKRCRITAGFTTSFHDTNFIIICCSTVVCSSCSNMMLLTGHQFRQVEPIYSHNLHIPTQHTYSKTSSECRLRRQHLVLI